MEVELYVYDLSGGMARQYSVALTGVYIDAIYHTAVVLGGVEYFFGQGIHRKLPGSTHHGRPMEVMKMGRTELPIEVIEEYIESLESIYTPESYDLFLHNCNNFSQDLCMLLVGKSIPENISSLPETFLKTPIGQMMRGQIDQSMRRMTQAPDAISAAPKQKHNKPIHPTHTQPSNSPSSPRGSPHQSSPKRSPTIQAPHQNNILPPPSTSAQPIDSLSTHVAQRSSQGASNAPLPDMHALSIWTTTHFPTLTTAQFALIDLLRIAALDPRVSAYLTTDPTIIQTILSCFAALEDAEPPYNLLFTTLQLCINLFSSPLAQEAMLPPKNDDKDISKESALRSLLIAILPPALLQQNSKVRLQAALLLINLAALDHNQRVDGREDLLHLESWADGAVVSALVQAVVEEGEGEMLEKLLLALGLVLWGGGDGVKELCEVMGVGEVLGEREAGGGVKMEVVRLLGGV